MKHIAHTRLLLPVCIGLLAVACEPANLFEQIADGPVFRVTGIDDTATKAAAEISGGTFTLPGLSGDVLTASGDTLRMRVHETAMTGMVRGTGPATKATPLTGTAFPDTLSFGLLACTYNNAGAAPSEWSYRDSVAARTDRDKTRADDKQSGKWVPVAAKRLKWPGSGFVRYFAYAPFTDADNDNIDDLTKTTPPALKVNATAGTEPSLEYTVPDDVGGQIDLLVATQRSTREYDGDPGYTAIDIPMTFCHALTGIRFRVGAGLTIDSVAVKGVYNHGKLGLAAAPAWDDRAGEASYTIKNPGLAPDPHDSSFQLAEPEYTMLLLPQTLPTGAKITATVKDASDVKYTVTANISGHIWQPGTMVTYTITDTDLSWVLEVIDETTGQVLDNITLSVEASDTTNIRSFTVRSYSSVNFGGLSGKIMAQDWKVEYSTNDGVSWSTNAPAWLNVRDTATAGNPAPTGLGGTDGEPRRLHIGANANPDKPTVYVAVGEDRIKPLRKKPVVGSETAPRDLSMYNIYGQENNSYAAGTQDVPGINAPGPHTSNCYVVNAPGWYCFPLVYGNAVDATRGDGPPNFKNDVAYGSSLSDTWFIDANENKITDAFILPEDADLGRYDAVVVWQDVKKGYEVLQDTNIFVVTKTVAGGSLPCPYIRFKIEKGSENMRGQANHDGYPDGEAAGILPCNIVLALRDTTQKDAGHPRILWSWHIWVTDTPHAYVPGGVNEDFAIRDLTYRKIENSTTELGKLQILNCILGWTPPLYFYGGGIVNERKCKIRFKQNASGGRSKEVTVIQQGHTPPDDDSGGLAYNGTYYQWGRKDPLLGGRALTGTNASNRTYTNQVGYIVGDPPARLASESGSRMEIRYPHKYISDKTIRFGKDATPSPSYGSGVVPTPIPFWNIKGDFTSASVDSTLKTVYDPCPPGFCVPFNRAFSGFYLNDGATTYGYRVDKIGWYLTADATEDPTNASYDIFFPFTGWRSNDENGVFKYDPSELSQGEGPWVSSLEMMPDNKRNTRFLRMRASIVELFVNRVSRGNVVRPMVEQVAATSPTAGTESYGSGGNAPF